MISMANKEAMALIIAAIDANFDKQVQFLAELVRFPSLRGREAPLQDWSARQMAARDYAVDRYTLADVPQHPKWRRWWNVIPPAAFRWWRPIAPKNQPGAA